MIVLFCLLSVFSTVSFSLFPQTFYGIAYTKGPLMVAHDWAVSRFNQWNHKHGLDCKNTIISAIKKKNRFLSNRIPPMNVIIRMVCKLITVLFVFILLTTVLTTNLKDVQEGKITFVPRRWQPWCVKLYELLTLMENCCKNRLYTIV